MGWLKTVTLALQPGQVYSPPSRVRAGFGALRGHKGEYAPFGPSRKSFRSLPYSKGPTTRSFKIATQLPFGLIEHVRRKDGAVAHCLPRRALPSFLQLQ